MAPNFLKADSIASVVTSLLAEAYGGSFEDLPDHFGYLANPVVLGIVTDIKNLIVNLLLRCREYTHDCFTDIRDMNERSPRRAIACHFDFLCCPRKTSEIVE